MTRALWIFAAIVLLRPAAGHACTSCTIYSLSRLTDHEPGSVGVLLDHQYIDFRRTPSEIGKNPRQGELVQTYTVTQLSPIYQFAEEWSTQLSIPLITRSYDVIENYRSDRELDVGVGDVSAFLYRDLHLTSGTEWFIHGSAGIGVKLPTGDTGSLERLTDDESPELNAQAFLRNHSVTGASGGRALTLGSGSTDALFSAASLARYGLWAFALRGQYALRTEGDFEYQFGNEVQWSVSAGGAPLFEHRDTVTVFATLSGEHKPSDQLDDEPVAGSRYQHLFLGPEVLITLSSNLSAAVGGDFLIAKDDPAGAVAPAARVRASLSYWYD